MVHAKRFRAMEDSSVPGLSSSAAARAGFKRPYSEAERPQHGPLPLPATQLGAAAPPPAPGNNAEFTALKNRLLGLPEHVRRPFLDQMADQLQRGMAGEDVHTTHGAA